LQDIFHNARDGHKYAKITIYRELQQLITIFHQQVNFDDYHRESRGKRNGAMQGVAWYKNANKVAIWIRKTRVAISHDQYIPNAIAFDDVI